MPPTTATATRRIILLVLAATVVYGAFAAERLLTPSRHFHFIDMAWNYIPGRLDTETPRRSRGPEQAGDPNGLQRAVERHLTGPGDKTEGWNDWASYHVIKLKDGQEVAGVWPWKDDAGARKHDFLTLEGQIMVIDRNADVATDCSGGVRGRTCDELKYFTSFPPFPAVVFMPFVAVWGYDTSDVLVTLLFAIASVGLFAWWLSRMRREGLHGLSGADESWWVLLLAFGTVAFFCSIRGEVWFTALVIGMTLNLLHLLAAENARAPLLAGLMLGLGVATRTPLLFAALLLPLEAFFPNGRWLGGEGREGFKRAFWKCFWYALPMALVGAALAWFNYVRFRQFGEFGHTYLLEGTRAPTREHGLFSFWFLNRNLGAALTNMPVFTDQAPFVLITRHGLGLLAATPALWLLLRRKPTVADAPVDAAVAARRKAFIRHMWVSVAAVAIPGLLYQNDGWVQFAYRFSMDFLPPLVALLALQCGPLGRTGKALIVASIAVQVLGAVTFGRYEMFYYD